MDPFSALSIATGVVAFVDFGAKLVARYVEIRESKDGQPAALSALQDESRELSSNASHMRDKVATLQTRYPRQSEHLDRLATECSLAERQLENLIANITAKSGRGLTKKVGQAIASIRSVLKQGEIQSLQDRLKNIREQTMMSIIMCISYVTFFTCSGVGLVSAQDKPSTTFSRILNGRDGRLLFTRQG